MKGDRRHFRRMLLRRQREGDLHDYLRMRRNLYWARDIVRGER